MERVRRIVRQSFKSEGVSRGQVSIVLSNDRFIKELNFKYRGVNRATDVLAFGFEDEECLGEIIISIPTCLRQAIEYGHSFEEELSLLLVHGVLHLLNYDHQKEAEAKVMQEREKEILTSIIRNKIRG